MKYKILSLDVWAGDEKNSWIKNDFFHVGDIDITDDQCPIRELVAAGFIDESINCDIYECGDDSLRYVEIFDSEDGYPIFDLVSESV